MASSNDGKSAADSLNIYTSWENLTYTVPDKTSETGEKTILHGLNGHVKPGDLVAVIGPSGSGKSSFLNCMAGRITDGVSGKILFNGVRRPSNYARFSGYVVQDDLYFQTLTVKETLTFAADLKLPMSFSKEKKRDKVEQIITDLDLHKCIDTQIGIVGKGISGGERRRLAIGLEIINEPSLLMLDEPTSGLDSASALMVGNILKDLAKKKNITVLCTIHQPRYQLATMFDKIYFLGKGHELFFGPTIPYCLEFFTKCGYPCPQYDNPADFLLDLVNTADIEESSNDKDKKSSDNDVELATTSVVVASNTEQSEYRSLASNTQSLEAKDATDATDVTDVTDTTDDASNNVTNTTNAADGKSRDEIIAHLTSEYEQSEYRSIALKFDIPSEDDGTIIFKTISKDFYITPWYNQLRVILLRSFLHKMREPIALMTQAFNALVIPFIFGSVYFQIDDGQQASFDRISAIALIVLMLSFFTFDILMLFPLERDIFNRENASGMYRPSMFYWGRTMAETPQHIILISIMATLTYWLYGLQNDFEKFINFVVLCVLAGTAGAGLMLVFSAYAKNLEQSNLLATFFILLFMLFDGNWISLDNVPIYYKWVRYCSFVGYGSQGAIVNEYSGLTFTCTTEEVTNNECIYTTGEEILYLRGLEDLTVSEAMWMLVLLQVIYRFIAFLGVLFLFRNEAPSVICKKMFCKSKIQSDDTDNQPILDSDTPHSDH